jgi:hypothetical protein
MLATRSMKDEAPLRVSCPGRILGASVRCVWRRKTSVSSRTRSASSWVSARSRHLGSKRGTVFPRHWAAKTHCW